MTEQRSTRRHQMSADDLLALLLSLGDLAVVLLANDIKGLDILQQIR